MQYVYLVLSLGLIAAGAWGIHSEWTFGMLPLLLGLGIGGQGARSWWNQRHPRLSLPGVREDEAALLTESYQKAVADYRYLEQARKQLEDRELVRQLGRMQHIAHNMLSYLERHPKKLPMAQRFIDYYQDRAVELVRKYQELEDTELTTERVAELKSRMKTTLSGFDAVYTEQFERILSDQMLMTDAELTVMEQHLDEQGIRLEKQEAHPRMGRAEDKRQDSFSLEGFLDNLKQKNYSGRHMKLSIIPVEEKSEVIKRKAIQSALAIFLGAFGAHKFYQGKKWMGILYALFFWTSIPAWIGIVEGIRYLAMPMDDFYLEYYRDD